MIDLYKSVSEGKSDEIYKFMEQNKNDEDTYYKVRDEMTINNSLDSAKRFEYIFENYNDENNFMFLDPPYDSEFTDYGYCQFGRRFSKVLQRNQDKVSNGNR